MDTVTESDMAIAMAVSVNKYHYNKTANFKAAFRSSAVE